VRPVIYAPLGAEPSPGAASAVIVRDRAGLATITSVLREEVRRLDPDLPLYGIETINASVARARNGGRLLGTWSGVIAVIALLMASVGLYALTAHAVAQRTHEIGVRVALGARPAQVVGLFMRRSLAQLALGLTLGIAGALAAGRLLQGFVSAIAIADLLTLSAVAMLLTFAALAACALPARRATRVDPVKALRAE
jgi:ABC-type antimicrobial peptide transport system permease subunit